MGGRPRWLLHVQAEVWRGLMQIGMFLHRLAPPQPEAPDFSVTIPSRISKMKGKFDLQFYVPEGYEENKNKGTGKKYPCVVNYHGGGFTLGRAHDDARWTNTVKNQVEAVVVSVNYRLAPEHPFPTAVEDGADAVLYLAKHAQKYHLDPDRMALSGFSSGGNMTLTVPLLLQNEVPDRIGPDESQEGLVQRSKPVHTNTDLSAKTIVKERDMPNIRGVISFYPPTDYTQTREQRRATNAATDQQISAIFTELFDDSYLHPPTLDLANPLLSPGQASTEMLTDLPHNIVIIACEYDMLLAEAVKFKERLETETQKNVTFYMVPEVPHAWDKAPNPLRTPESAKEYYTKACDELKKMFQV